MRKLFCIHKTQLLEEVKQAKQTFQSQPGVTCKSIPESILIKSVPKIIQKKNNVPTADLSNRVVQSQTKAKS